MLKEDSAFLLGEFTACLDSTEELTICQSFAWSKSQTLKGHLDSVNQAIWAKSGLFSVSDDCLLRGWLEGRSGFCVRDALKPLFSLARGGAFLFTAGLEGLVRGYSIGELLGESAKSCILQKQLNSPVLRLNAQDELLLCVQSDQLAVLRPEADSFATHFSLQVESRLLSSVWRKGSPLISTEEGHVFQLELSKLKVLKVLREEEQIGALTTLDGDDVLVGAGDKGVLGVYDVRTGRRVSSIFAHEGGVGAVAFHQERALVSTGGRDGSIRTWELRRQRCLFESRGHREKWGRGVCSLQLHARLPAMLSAGADGSICIFSQSK